MTHLAERITNKIYLTLNNSPLFNLVKRSNAYPNDPLDLPQINIIQGDDKIVDDESTIGNRVFVSQLSIQFVVHVAFSDQVTIEKQLSDIRADLNILLCADDFVEPYLLDIYEIQASKPDISKESEFQIMAQEIEYLVLYRRRHKDPTQ